MNLKIQKLKNNDKKLKMFKLFLNYFKQVKNGLKIKLSFRVRVAVAG